MRSSRKQRTGAQVGTSQEGNQEGKRGSRRGFRGYARCPEVAATSESRSKSHAIPEPRNRHMCGGGRGIRTPGTVASPPVFKTGAQESQTKGVALVGWVGPGRPLPHEA